MKIYKLVFDVNHYQSLMYVEDKNGKEPTIRFDSTPKAEDWIPPAVYSDNPMLKAGHFWYFRSSSGALVLTPEAIGVMSENILEKSGEVLPLPFEGQQFKALNILECVNCLDVENCVWPERLYNVGSPRRYAFFPHRFSDSSLFKIPQTAAGNILTLECEGDPEYEFKACVEKNKLTGLNFELLWDSDTV